MIDIGEDLVGAYLRVVQKCDVVAFNTRTGQGQGEIDVIGVKLNKGQIDEVWLCEVSTHTSGLGGYRGDPIGKLAAKLKSVYEYADTTYPGDIERHIEFWSPRVRSGLVIKLENLKESRPDLVHVVNDLYAERIIELYEAARRTSSYSDHPSFRMLQILACLPREMLLAPVDGQVPFAKTGNRSL